MKLTKEKLYQLIQEQLSDEEQKFYGKNLSDMTSDTGAFATIPTISKEDYEWWERYGSEGDLVNWASIEFPWIEKNIGRLIGEGAFRKVYELGSNLVVKIAYGKGEKTGRDTNYTEGVLFNKYPNIFPKSYAFDPEGKWLICEKVKVIEFETDFYKTIFNYFPALNKILLTLYHDNSEGLKSDDDYFDDGNSAIECISCMSKIWNQIKRAFKKSAKLDHRGEREFKEFFLYRDFDQKAVNSAWNALVNDSSHGARNFMVWFQTILKLDIELWDIREKNVGITNDGKFVIIDISIFDETVMPKLKAQKSSTGMQYDHSKRDISKDPEYEKISPTVWRHKT